MNSEASSRLFQVTIIGLLAMLLPGCSETNPSGTDENPGGEVALHKLATPDDCAGCHPSHVSAWKSSMHAYAFRDPVFFALNRIGQQRSGNQLDQYCVRCHSPIASFLGEAEPGFELENLSPLAKSGVSCDVCHSMQNPKRGESIREFVRDGTRSASLPDPQENSFHASRFDPNYSLSAICAPCHDVFTPDAQKQLEFTSTEWDVSPYSAMGLECQDCHMPSRPGKAAVGGPDRQAVHDHSFIGVDTPLIDFPGAAETISRVDSLLRNSLSMRLIAPAQTTGGDSLLVEIMLLNDRTGHNIPSGTAFDRQMWLEVILSESSSGDTLFASGLLDRNDDLINHHSEAVKSGDLEPDRNLTLFNAVAYKNGEETPFFWEADSVANFTIPAFQSRIARYNLPTTSNEASLNLSVRLLFRSFPPYLLREIGEHTLLPQLQIFEMASSQKTISLQ